MIFISFIARDVIFTPERIPLGEIFVKPQQEKLCAGNRFSPYHQYTAATCRIQATAYFGRIIHVIRTQYPECQANRKKNARERYRNQNQMHGPIYV